MAVDALRRAPSSRLDGQRALITRAGRGIAVAALDGKIYVVGSFGGQRELEIRRSVGAGAPLPAHRASSRGGGSEQALCDRRLCGRLDQTGEVLEYNRAADR